MKARTISEIEVKWAGGIVVIPEGNIISIKVSTLNDDMAEINWNGIVGLSRYIKAKAIEVETIEDSDFILSLSREYKKNKKVILCDETDFGCGCFTFPGEVSPLYLNKEELTIRILLYDWLKEIFQDSSMEIEWKYLYL